MPERRRFPRRAGPFDATFESASGPQSCRVSEISWTGCFVHSPERPSTDTFTTVTLIATGTVVALRARVTGSSTTTGFAVEFTDLDQDTLQRLHPILGEPAPY